MHDEPRDTVSEIFDLYFEFIRDEQEKLTQRGIRTSEHEELLFRFIAYMKHVQFITVKRAAELRKMQEWGQEQMQALEEEKKRFKQWFTAWKEQRQKQEQALQQLVQQTKHLNDGMFGQPGGRETSFMHTIPSNGDLGVYPVYRYISSELEYPLTVHSKEQIVARQNALAFVGTGLVSQLACEDDAFLRRLLPHNSFLLRGRWGYRKWRCPLSY